MAKNARSILAEGDYSITLMLSPGRGLYNLYIRDYRGFALAHVTAAAYGPMSRVDAQLILNDLAGAIEALLPG